MATAVDVTRSAASGARLRAGLPAWVPAWISSQAVNTWGEVPTSNLLTDLDPDLDAAVNPDYPATSGGKPVAPWRPAGVSAGAFVNITDWCGAIADTDDHEMWWTMAGGHNSAWDAASYKLALNQAAPAYVRVSVPTGAVGQAAFDYMVEMARGDVALDSRGRPRTHHTVNFGCYWPGVGLVNLSEIIICNSGGTEPGHSHPWVVSRTTGEMTYRGANNNNNAAGGWDAACYDSVRNVAWKYPTSSATNISRWGGPASDSWTALGPVPGGGTGLAGSCSLCHSPDLDLILIGNGGGYDPRSSSPQTIVGGWAVVDPADGSWHYPTFTGAPTSAPQAFATGLWPGTCQPRWSARLGAYLAWDNTSNTTQIMRITPPASGDPRTASWTIDYLPVSGSNAVTPSAALVAGTYGRFAIFDDLGIAVVQNAASARPHFFRYA